MGSGQSIYFLLQPVWLLVAPSVPTVCIAHSDVLAELDCGHDHVGVVCRMPLLYSATGGHCGLERDVATAEVRAKAPAKFMYRIGEGCMLLFLS